MMNLSIILIAILPSIVSSFISTSKCTRCISSFSLSYAKSSSEDESVVHVSSSLHQPIPSTFLSLGQTESDWKEWQYSFGRNGLTDFLPQFSGHLNCLAIDLESQQYDPSHLISDDTIESITQLPWQYGDDENEQATTSISTNISVSTRSSDKEGKDTELELRADYDCILDSGVMNEIISSIPSTVTWHSRNGPPALLDLVKLMAEASQSIREFGIYVAITNESIPDHAKDYLDQMGETMGLEWTYDLDGLSKEGYSVSVARKYFTGLVNVGGVDIESLGTKSDMKQLKP